MKKTIRNILVLAILVVSTFTATVPSFAATKKTTYKDCEYTIHITNTKTVKVTGHFDTEMGTQLVTLLNKYRKANGLNTLKVKTSLYKAALIRAYEVSYKFDHYRPSGKSCFTASSAMYAENISSGYKTASKIMSGWKASAGHNANMLRSNVNYIGIAVFCRRITTSSGKYTYITYAVQCFGK